MRLGEEGWGQAGGGETCQRIDGLWGTGGLEEPAWRGWGMGHNATGSDGQARPHSAGLRGGP